MASFEPTTRSRTGLFLSYRESSPRLSRHQYHVEDEEALLIGGGLGPKWVDYAEEIEEIIRGTVIKINTLDKLHAKHVLPGFSDRSFEEREIESLSSHITTDFRRCHSLIQKITLSHKSLPAKNAQRALAAQVQDLSASLRKKHRVYMEKLQGHAIKNQDLLIASGTISLRGSDGMTAVDDDVAAASHTQRQSLSFIQHDPETATLYARDRELSEIAKSIAQLAELFKDLSALVIDQGTLLDSVEYNIEQTAIRMEDAVKELNVAQTYQRNTGRRKCILLLLLIIFGLILVLIFKPRSHSTPLSPAPPSVPGTGQVDIDGLSVALAARLTGSHLR